jgi:PAS domain S-box-containing protein
VAADGSGWEDLFWFVFERSSNPIALIDMERRIVDSNQAFLELLGRTRGWTIGRQTNDTVARRERTLASDSWRSFLATGEDSGTRTLERGDGTEVEVEFARRLATIGGRRLAVYAVTAQLEEGRFTKPGHCDPGALTPREVEVVKQIALGLTTDAIAAELSISPETVRTHVRNAMAKLKVHTRAQLVVDLAQGWFIGAPART